MRKPIDDFLLVKDKIMEIGQTRDMAEIFKEFSEALALVENDILTDNVSEDFLDDLGSLIISYLSMLSVKYNIDDLYDFLISRSHWGVYEKEHFKNKRKALIEPYYKARISCSQLILDRDKKASGISIRPLFDLAAYLIHLEEI